jgi:type II secretory pathway pseudopilin PulG
MSTTPPRSDTATGETRIVPARSDAQAWLAKAALESLLIVFSVLLALSVDSWREARDRANKLAEARAALVAELRFNRQLLTDDRYLAHHIRLHTVYDAMESAGRTDEVNALFRTGIHRAPLRDAAWRSFSLSDIANDMAFADRTLLAGIYDEQDSLDTLHRTLLANVSAPTPYRENPAYLRDLVHSIDLTLSDIVYSEQALLTHYTSATATLTAAGR